MHNSLTTLPLILTYSRILLAFTLILINQFIDDIINFKYLLIGFIFVLASLTDWLDGLLARKLNLESRLGAMLDPISDKILSVAAILILVSENIAPVTPCALIIFREIFISGLREYLSSDKFQNLKVTFLAKLKTFSQFIALTLLLIAKDIKEYLTINIIEIGIYALWLATFLTVWTGCIYFYKSISYLSKE